MTDRQTHTLPWPVVLLIGLLVTSCVPDPEPSNEMTVVVYMAADNNLAPFARMDIKEIERSQATLPENAKLIVHMDTSALSTDSLHMLTTLRQLYADHPADRYALVLWSHGIGWLGFGKNRYSQRMDIPTLRGVLEQLPHMEYILFDACHMQCVEVAYELRHTADYIIGSPAEIPGTGAPYDRIARHLFAPTEQAVRDITQTYFRYYEQNSEGCVLSVVDTHHLEAISPRLIRTLRELCRQDEEPDLLLQQHYGTYCYDTNYLPDFYDINSVLYHLTGEDWPLTQYFLASDVWGVSSGSTFHQICDREHSVGLSVFVPTVVYSKEDLDRYIQKYRTLEWGAALLKD